MTAEQLLKQGDLDGALHALQDQIRKVPQDPRLRIFLFQLLCIMGDWQRAVLQLKTCATLDPSANAMAQMYRTAIMCELVREQVFRGEKQPLVFGEPEEWTAWMIEALKRDAEGNPQAASDLRARAFDAAPAISGTLNDRPFEWIADADTRLGPLLEMVINGRYFWVPFSAIAQLLVEAPTDLRDRVWMPVSVTWTNGGDTVALVPTRYVATVSSPDAQLKLALSTQWQEQEDATPSCLGQRLLATSEHDCALMDVRKLVFEGAVPSGDATMEALSEHG